MSNNGAIQTNDYHGRAVQFVWWTNEKNVNGNFTKIGWKIVGVGKASASWYKAGNFKVIIDNNEVYYSSNRIQLYENQEIASGEYTLYHDNLGNRNFSAYVECGIYEVAVNCRADGNWWLDNIPRYFSVTPKISLISKTETSYTFRWETSELCDWVRWYWDGGNVWHDVGNPNSTSGTFEVKNGDYLKNDSSIVRYITINENSMHNVRAECRRADSGLWSFSEWSQNTTYAYPYIESTDDFIIGNPYSIKIYNPLGRDITVDNISNKDGTVIGSYTGTYHGILTGFNDTTSISRCYSSIPSSKTGTYYSKLTYGSIVRTKGNSTYYCNENECKPTLNSSSISYIDSNSTTVAITANNQHIIQNKSNVKITVGGGTAKKSASISKYRVVLNGVIKEGTGTIDFGKLNVSSNIKYQVTAIDSRGYSSPTVEKTITVLEYKKPQATIDLKRLNNYEDENYLTVNASISSINNKNTMTIKYGYAQSSSSTPTATITIANNTKITNSLDKNYEWKFIVKVTDKLETSTFTVILPKGKFIEFWDTEKLSVGIGGFPTHNGSLEVFGDLYVNGADVLNYSTTEKYAGKWLDGKTIYRKTIEFGALPNSANKSVAHGISGLDKVVRLYGIAVSSSTFMPLPYSHATDNLNIRLFATKTNVSIHVSNDRSSLTGFITIFYTKN